MTQMPDAYPPGRHVSQMPLRLRTIEPVANGRTAFLGRWEGDVERPPQTLRGYSALAAWLADVPPSVAAAGLCASLRLFFDNGGQEACVLPLGSASRAPTHADYLAALATLETPGSVAAVCLPGQPWVAPGNPVVQAAIDQAERLGDRMVLVDPPVGLALTDAAGVAALELPASPYAACYYPWVEVADPRATAGASAPRLSLPPSGAMAGLWARSDASRGVWKAPAGLEARVRGITGLVHPVTRVHLQVLNPRGVNAIVDFPGRACLAWGARTLAPPDDHERRYLPVQRLALFLRESLRQGLSWVAGSANDAALWASLRLSVATFLDGLHRAGALQGASPRQAYFVRCGLGDTMTPDDLARHRVVIQLGVAVMKRGEFMVLRLVLAAGPG